jgi:RNA polymerase sigma factor (sigma-70 family)
MSKTTPFDELWCRARKGDQEAWAELERRYGSYVRRIVRLNITDPQLGRVVDSMDICQSVWASLFIRAAGGQYEIHGPDDLLKLLGAMARNKVKFQARKECAQRRDNRRQERSGRVEEIASGDSSPSHRVSAQELVKEVRRRLSSEELELLELRKQGLEWPAIAEKLGGSPEALRKKLARAIDRMAHALGLDDFHST